jgi:hypothetical protein
MVPFPVRIRDFLFFEASRLARAYPSSHSMSKGAFLTRGKEATVYN